MHEYLICSICEFVYVIASFHLLIIGIYEQP